MKSNEPILRQHFKNHKARSLVFIASKYLFK